MQFYFRRAEWFRILGVYPRNNRVFLCRAHIPECYLFGNKVSRYALPIPPESRKFSKNLSAKNEEYNDISSSTDYAEFFSDEIQLNEISQTTNEDVQTASQQKQEKEQSQEKDYKKIDSFEIRKGKSMIIKGRFIQTNNYLMVSYTPPKKWSLQKQVQILDEQCAKQLNQVRTLNRENFFLRKELSKYEKLLPKLRYLQRCNRVLYAKLKMYKLKDDLRKCQRRRQLKKLKEDVAELEHNNLAL